MKVALVFAGVVSVISVLAADYTWTRLAGNGKWTDSGNWSPSGVPGCYLDGDVEQGGNSVDTATFGADASSADAVSIDLAGHRYVKAVVIASGAPAYTFGTSAAYAQSLGINTNGSITVNKNVTRNQNFPWVRVISNGCGPVYKRFNAQRAPYTPTPDSAWKVNYPISFDEFHTFGLLWEPDGYTVFVDGRQSGYKVGKLGDEVVSEPEEFIFVSTELKVFRQDGKPVPEVATACAAGDEFTVDFVRVYDFAD